MKTKQVLALLCASLLAAPALAGINPASPGLPTASTANQNQGLSYTGFTAPNNQVSAMCVDCHTVQPKAGGSHYVNPTNTGGATNSGGSGIGADAQGLAQIVTRDNGAYFKVTAWNVNTAGSAGVSKYGDVGATGGPKSYATAATGTATVDASVGTYAGRDIICESCHNILTNEAGGNNLLLTQPNNEWEDAPVAELCVGCHGFMYAEDAANSSVPANLNYADARNNNEITTGEKKRNNEVHWVKGVAYPQNHHVMTGDNIDNIRAGARLLWTDNDVVGYTSAPISNAATHGTYPQRATWTNLNKPSNAGWLNCTNCHAPAHGQNASPAASILRNATYTGTAQPTAELGPISRISDRNGWKKINDLAFCGQCHE